jgi:peptidoglycan-associated lipoprotein
MKNLPRLLALSVCAAALAFTTGCPKKPVRTGLPDSTIGTSNNNTDPNSLGTFADQNTALQPRDLSADGLGSGQRGVVDPVYFEFDRFAVPTGERNKLEKAAQYLKDNAAQRLVLEGHCDWRGTAEYNLGLGDRRANAVMKYLEYLGVDSKRLEIVSKGDQDSKEGASEEEMKKDRRVEFIGLDK